VKCVITGAALIDPNTARWLPGDLFDLGSHYLFNGNFRGGQLQWLDITDPSALPPNTFKTYDQHWERRGVFIIEKLAIELSPEAKAYIERSPR
jgi:hypothetical protein